MKEIKISISNHMEHLEARICTLEKDNEIEKGRSSLINDYVKPLLIAIGVVAVTYIINFLIGKGGI